jgi:CRISPR-associated endoribonuclease Cas6
MRFSCEYKTSKLPVANKMMFVSLIKNALINSNKDYFEELYYYEDKKNKATKNFTFSLYMKDFKLEGDCFEIGGKVILNISTPDYGLGINLFNGLMKINHFSFKEFELHKIKISIIKEKCITEKSVIFKTLSPIFIKNKDNLDLSPEDRKYLKELNYISNTILKNYRGYGLREELDFKVVNMKKTVVKEEITDFTNVTGKKYLYANGYSGAFMLSGDIEDLRDLYMLGLGFKRNQGFGMVEVV